MVRRLWRLSSLLLGFLAFLALGFGVRRSNEPMAPQLKDARCASEDELQRLLGGLEHRVAHSLSPEQRADRRSRPAVTVEALPWQAVARWIRRYQAVAEAVVTLRGRPKPETLASLQVALGESPHPCLSAEAWASASIAEGLERRPPRGGLSVAGVRELGAKGCEAVVSATIDALLARDSRLASAQRLFAHLSGLEQPADSQQRLHQLRALQAELLSEDSPLVVQSLSGPRLGPGWGVSEFLRLRGELAEQAPESCLPETPARVQERMEARFLEVIAGTGLFTQQSEQWQVSSEVTRMGSALDAFFALEFVQRRAPSRCRLTNGVTHVWDRDGLARLAKVLENYQRSGQLERFSTALREREGLGFPKLWAALPEAACGKLTQNLCVELNQARRPLPDESLPELAVARAQAASLEATRDVWEQIAQHASAFGCSANSFGLDESQRSARALLETAHRSLQDMHQRILQRAAGLAEPRKGESQNAPKAIQGELSLVRRELSAIAAGLVVPALEHLDVLGTTDESPSRSPNADDAGLVAELHHLDAWRALVDDLRSPAAFVAGDRAVPAGQSGVFAYERWAARLLSLAPRHCDMALLAWRDGVFDDSKHIFHRLGRSGSEQLLQQCKTR